MLNSERLLCDITHFYLNYTLIILVLLFNFGSFLYSFMLNAVFFWGPVFVSRESLKSSLTRVPAPRLCAYLCRGGQGGARNAGEQ